MLLTFSRRHHVLSPHNMSHFFVVVVFVQLDTLHPFQQRISSGDYPLQAVLRLFYWVTVTTEIGYEQLSRLNSNHPIIYFIGGPLRSNLI